MADVKRRPVKQVRLQQLASEARLPTKPNQAPVRDDRSKVTFMLASHTKEARDMLMWRRTWDTEYKSSLVSFSSKSKESPVFALDEINRAVKAIVNENGSPGVVEALLDIGEESKQSIWDKMKGKDQKINYSDLLAAAVWKHSYDTVKLLASRSDEASLNSALPITLRNQDLVAARILLERGADLTPYHTEFMAVMTGGNSELTELLICAPRPPCYRCRSEALVAAVKNSSLHLTSLLVQRGVDPDWQDWAAMRSAIQNRQKDIVLAIVSGPYAPSAASLDGGLGFLYSAAGADLDFVTKVAEILLCAGAQGENAANVLVAAAKSQQLALLDLIINYGGSVDFREGEAVRNSIIEKNTTTLARLLRGKPTFATLSKVLEAAQSTLLDDLKYAKDTVGRLLSAGLKGEAIDKFLYQVVLRSCQSGPNGQDSVLHMDSLDLVSTLVDRGHADVNFGGAQSLKVAARSACLDVLRILLSKSPTESSLNAAFYETSKIPLSEPRRIQVLTTLLDSGARGTVVDQALVASVQQGRVTFEETKLFLRVASLDYNQGAALKAAIFSKQMEQLDLLLETRPTTATLRYVWDDAAKIEDNPYQYAIYTKLLGVDPEAAPLDRELVATVSRGEAAQQTCKLLLEAGAHVDFNNGLPLTAAVNAQNMAALKLLLEKQPPPSTLHSAAQSVWQLRGHMRIEYAQVLLVYGLEESERDAGLLIIINEEYYDMELVRMLLRFKASAESKDGEAITIAVQKQDLDLLVALTATISSPKNLTNALTTLLSQSWWHTSRGLPLLQRLLAHGATSPWIDSAFIQSCADHHHDASHILIEHLSSEAALTSALDTTISQSLSWQLPEGLATIETLLSRGASAAILKPAFIQAASVFNISAVLLLQHHICDPATATAAWGEATLTNTEWLKESSLPVLEILLESGASADVNFALLEAVAASTEGRELVSLVDLLLRHGANPNHNGGQPLRHAAGNGCPTLIQMFCQHTPSNETVRFAFFDLVMGRAQRNPALVLACMRYLQDCPTSKLDLNWAPDGMDLPLIQILLKFPNSPDITRFVLEAGADIMSRAICPLILADADDWRCVGQNKGDTKPAGLRLTEEVPALLWALMQPKTELTDAVIDTLIEMGADVNFATPCLGFTPLILAAKHERSAIIARLLGRGANRDATDHFHNTALVYAARHGSMDCVELLLNQRTRVNDGSLHEAARGLHYRIVEVLISAAHDPNFGSEMHQGRTALGELCLLSKSSADGVALDRTLQALASGGADPLRKTGTMLPIFLALGNSDPKPLVEKLAEKLMHTNLGHPDLIMERDQLAYSPTMYLKKLVLPSAGNTARTRRQPSADYHSGPYPADTDFQIEDDPVASHAFHVHVTTVYTEILNFLLVRGATDRFYYTGMEYVQPAGMVGATDDVIGRENVRRTRLAALQASSADYRASPQPAMMMPGVGHNGNVGWNMWAPGVQGRQSALNSAPSAAQARVTEEKRQIEDRRVLSELVNRHMAQQDDIRKETKKLQLQVQNKSRLDREALQTEWMATQAARASQLGSGGSQVEIQLELLKLKEAGTIRQLLAARNEKLSAHQIAMDGVFGDEEYRRIARRPEGGTAALIDAIPKTAQPDSPELTSADIADLYIHD